MAPCALALLSRAVAWAPAAGLGGRCHARRRVHRCGQPGIVRSCRRRSCRQCAQCAAQVAQHAAGRCCKQHMRALQDVLREHDGLLCHAARLRGQCDGRCSAFSAPNAIHSSPDRCVPLWQVRAIRVSRRNELLHVTHWLLNGVILTSRCSSAGDYAALHKVVRCGQGKAQRAMDCRDGRERD